jgi:hypothetical protein
VEEIRERKLREIVYGVVESGMLGVCVYMVRLLSCVEAYNDDSQ